MKTKLLLADDEPLVLVGLQSMLKWENYDVEIVGAAHNGGQLETLIHEKQPDLVIADIKMPVKDGLQVLRTCREAGKELPLFILLTSFEKFDFVRNALQLQAVDYLVKLELTPDSLAAAVVKAQKQLGAIRGRAQSSALSKDDGLSLFYERFFVRLYNNLFEDREQFELQRRELGVDFSFAKYAVCCCEILDNGVQLREEKRAQLYASTIRMLRETINRFMACYITSLDFRHFNITFCLSEQEVPAYQDNLRRVIDSAMRVVRDYFNVRLSCRVGCMVEDPYCISHSVMAARSLAISNQEGIVSFFTYKNSKIQILPDIAICRKQIGRAFEQMDTQAIREMLTRIADQLGTQAVSRSEAMDAATSLLYMAVTLLPDGEETLQQVFPGDTGYRCLYKCCGTVEISQWVRTLCDGLCTQLQARQQDYKQRLVDKVKQHIRGHLNQKLQLNQVAACFGISPSYLSQLFAKYAGSTFVEFTTREKVAAAKLLMHREETKVYAIAEQLGFESAFYFSKVFKKVEGCSPREYMQRLQSASTDKTRKGRENL